MKWLILASWWAQGMFERVQRHHLTTDPACERHVPAREGSLLDRWSRGIECEPCMVRRALGDHEYVRFNLVHNHGTEDGPGLACNERRLPNGQPRGACLADPEPHVSESNDNRVIL